MSPPAPRPPNTHAADGWPKARGREAWKEGKYISAWVNERCYDITCWTIARRPHKHIDLQLPTRELVIDPAIKVRVVAEVHLLAVGTASRQITHRL